MENNFIIKRIYELLRQRNWTVYRLAKETSIPHTTLYNLLERETAPNFITLRCIADGMGITLSQFFDDVDLHDLNERQRSLLERYRLLDDEKKNYLEAYLKGLAQI